VFAVKARVRFGLVAQTLWRGRVSG